MASKMGFHTFLYPVQTVQNIVHFVLGKKLSLQLYKTQYDPAAGV